MGLDVLSDDPLDRLRIGSTRHEDAAISYEEAMRNADSKNELRLRIKLESKREAVSAERHSQTLRILEEDSAATF